MKVKHLIISVILFTLIVFCYTQEKNRLKQLPGYEGIFINGYNIKNHIDEYWNKSFNDLESLLNELMASYGNTYFDQADIDYFKKQIWYKPIKDIAYSDMSPINEQNAKILGELCFDTQTTLAENIAKEKNYYYFSRKRMLKEGHNFDITFLGDKIKFTPNINEKLGKTVLTTYEIKHNWIRFNIDVGVIYINFFSGFKSAYIEYYILQRNKRLTTASS